MEFIPVSTPSLSGADAEAVAACIRDGWISSEGPQVAEFESRFADTVGMPHAVAVANGTAALDLALEALGIGPGDEVIMPSFTIVSCLNHVLRSGATPVFVDCSPDTWNIDVSGVEEAITPQTKAIIVVHIYGLPADIDRVVALANTHNIEVIEDSAEAHGQHLEGRTLGSFGTLSTFSFYSNKLITTGEGGMVLSTNAALADSVRSLRNLSFDPQRRFVHESIGWNYRMTAMQAALGLSQLGRMAELLAYKQDVGRYYQQGMQEWTGVTRPMATYRGSENVYWVFGIVLPPEHQLSAQRAMELLRDKGIGTRPFFYPLHQQPVLAKYGFAHQKPLPVSEWLGEQGFYLPNGADLTHSQLDYVMESVRDVIDA